MQKASEHALWERRGKVHERTRGYGLKLKEGQFRLHTKKKFFDHEGGKTVAQVAWRGGGCLIPGSIQGQFGQV